MYSKRKKQNCGQLAIFIALIFQLVFILFAMSLNVALVVHDKINLQNSVDLAAYYGAMKQAQTLNAIAHINYQIRQSWKLLAWRYRVLGNPYAAMKTLEKLPSDQENLEFWPDTESPRPPYSHPSDKDVYIACTAATDAQNDQGWGQFRWPGGGTDLEWTLSGGKDNAFCTEVELDISLLTVPSSASIASGFSGLMSAIISTATTANTDIEKKCEAYAYTNWLFAFFSLYHFRMDQSRKAQLIYKIAEQVAGAGKEIDSQQLIRNGATKTFMNNLTYINKESFKPDTTSNFKTHDSLEKSYGPNQWLSPESFYMYPLMYVLSTLDGASGNPDACKAQAQFINVPPGGPFTIGRLAGFVQNLILTYSSNPNSLCSNNICDASAGLSKKDNFIVYFGAKAELQYENQIFLPFFTNHKLTLKAQAFAKPFGGRIGPKFEDDKTLPRLTVGTTVTEEKVSKSSPNYAKYPGDKFGLASHYVQKQWAERLYMATDDRKDIENYIHDDLSTPPDSPLSEGSESKQWELAAVAPDLFDVTYFTILPSYMETYYGNLQAWPGFNPPRDFGGGIKQQLSAGVWPVPALNPSMDRPFYVIKNLSHLLTGWNPPKEKYKDTDIYPASSSETQFAKCDKWDYQLDDDGDARMATGCVFGGRTGYSVKMINKEHLRDDVIRGGLTPIPSGSGWNW